VQPSTSRTILRHRKLGRTGLDVSEIGYGMWGLAAWKDTNDNDVLQALQLAIDLGCNFFDTAWDYGSGRSEQILGELVRANPQHSLRIATKIPPKNRRWIFNSNENIEDIFPDDHIREYTELSLENLDVDQIDLLLFHVWEDHWFEQESWQRTIADLKSDKLVAHVGISLNRWEPSNGLLTLTAGLIDAVQVIYNIFDQAPEDELFHVCDALDIGVIARVPFDEGSLTGSLRLDSTWPEGDWRNTYFGEENLRATVGRVENLMPLLPARTTLAEWAIRFILSNSTVSTVIPGMRSPLHVAANVAAATAGPLSSDQLAALRAHRWDREPAAWSE